jgi:16S rRNA (cytosine967-C5)-methyltransferase
LEEEDVTDHTNSREIVLDMLLEVIEGGKYSHTVLNQTLKNHQQMEKQERAFISRLFTGTVKVYLTLDYVINRFSTLPVEKMKPFIRNLLRMSVYQIMYMDQVPVSAVCNEAVKLAKKRSFAKLSGFVNGVLRNIARGVKEITFPDKEKDPVSYLGITYSFPTWLVAELLQQFDFVTVEAMLAASLKEKETTIRCNRKKVSPEKLGELLTAEGVTVMDNEYLDYAFKIKDYDYLEKIEAFQKGFFAIQDVSSMLVCEVSEIGEDDFVVDVCAAPGGKALHAAEMAKEVSARDLTAYKTGLIEENIKRLGYTNVTAKVWDATILDEEIVGKADVVIADLPCSGLGVFGKKSDIKYKLTQNQQKELVELQRMILMTVQAYVKEGGLLIFSTCTVNREENQGNREWFLKNFDFEPVTLNPHLPELLRNDTTVDGYLQLIQGIHNTDGFFISKFRKKPAKI